MLKELLYAFKQERVRDTIVDWVCVYVLEQ